MEKSIGSEIAVPRKMQHPGFSKSANFQSIDVYSNHYNFKIEESLRSLVVKVFKYYEKYDIQDKYLEVFENAIEKCEDFIEVIEVIKEMISTLMTHVQSITRYELLTSANLWISVNIVKIEMLEISKIPSITTKRR